MTVRVRVCFRSFGVILWEILTLNLPYVEPGGDLDTDMHSKLITRVLVDVPQGLRPTLPETAKDLNGPPLLSDPDAAEQLYQGIKALIQRCWSANPDDRPAMKEVASVLSGALRTIEASHATRAT